jgi:hypothetical protein
MDFFGVIPGPLRNLDQVIVWINGTVSRLMSTVAWRSSCWPGYGQASMRWFFFGHDSIFKKPREAFVDSLKAGPGSLDLFEGHVLTPYMIDHKSPVGLRKSHRCVAVPYFGFPGYFMSGIPRNSLFHKINSSHTYFDIGYATMLRSAELTECPVSN